MQKSYITYPLLLSFFLFSVAAQAQPHLESAMRQVSVSGSGKVSVKPDSAHLRLGHNNRSENLQHAMQDNNRRMSQTITALKEMGVSEKNIRTGNFRISQQRQNTKIFKGKSITIIYFTVHNSVEVDLEDIKKTGAVIDKAVSLGLNDISGVRFYVKNPTPYYDKALKAAMEDAERKARLLAKLSNSELGAVIDISEGNRNIAFQPRVARRGLVAETVAIATPVQEGELDVSAQISISWQLQ